MKAISIKELREWYETKTLAEVMDHFDLRHKTTLYRLLDSAEIPRKLPRLPEHSDLKLVP